MAHRLTSIIVVAVIVAACGGSASAPSLSTQTPTRVPQAVAAPTATAQATPSPTAAAMPWPIGLSRAQVAAVLARLGYEPDDTQGVPAGTYVASSGSDVLATATITGSEERVTGIDTTFYAGGDDHLMGLWPFFVSGVSGADIDKFFNLQARRFEATGEYAEEELQIPGAIVQWDVSQHANGANGLSISVAEY